MCKIKKKLNILLIKRNIRLLYKKKDLEQFHLRIAYPKAIEKMDNVESIKPEVFKKINFDIEKHKRLLNIKNNERKTQIPKTSNSSSL